MMPALPIARRELTHVSHARFARRAIVPQARGIALYPKSAASSSHPASPRGALRESSWTWRRGAVAARYRSASCVDERCFADGQAVWSWHPDAGVKFAGLS